ncbi:hypothetical protein BFW38_10930 [Terasakiispira papahanaumokuakeensis]|uniref:Outer membrane protein n=1 Tax=Terasakiispira papahanaumokuakeensis TaxID=197479 RepID=A0A1E2VAW6_9GAMM|nr:TIGR04219 family outer membrane beta-barrel protein [Terasakiispira papahanaumokuakeensis]ODC03976.1 hypothetical protein BFW38_10930 [Terasakiispira papahanaumokuakeensis]
MKKAMMCAAVASLPFALMTLPAQADTLGVYAGANLWDASADTGRANNAGEDEVDFGLDDDTANQIWIAIEHPIPLVPNLKVQRTDLSINGDSTYVGQFNDTTFAGDVDTKADLSHTDATLYYELLDGLGWMSLDLGVTARMFDGEMTVKQNIVGQSSTLKLDKTLPMLYGHAQFHLPLSGLSAGVEANYAGYSGNNVSDVSAKVTYEMDITPILSPGFEVGYRRFNAELDDVDDIDADMTVDGMYAGVFLHF